MKTDCIAAFHGLSVARLTGRLCLLHDCFLSDMSNQSVEAQLTLGACVGHADNGGVDGVEGVGVGWVDGGDDAEGAAVRDCKKRKLQSKVQHSRGLSIRFEGADLPSTTRLPPLRGTALPTEPPPHCSTPTSQHSIEQANARLTGEALGLWQVDVGVADQPHANRGVLDDAIVHAAQGLGNEHLAEWPAGWHGRGGAGGGRWVGRSAKRPGQQGQLGCGRVVQAQLLQDSLQRGICLCHIACS